MCVLLCIFRRLETQDRRLKNPFFFFFHITDRLNQHQHKAGKNQRGLIHNSTHVTLTSNALKWPNPNTWTIKNNAYLIWYETTNAKMTLNSCRRNIWQPSPVSARLMQTLTTPEDYDSIEWRWKVPDVTTASSSQTADPPTTARLTETLMATEDYDIRMMLKSCRHDDSPTERRSFDSSQTENSVI